MLYYIFLFAFCLFKYSAAVEVLSAVAGGAHPVEPHKYPWLVSLNEFSTTFEHPNGIFRPDCGASLLPVPRNDKESDIVITCAHCIVELDFVDGRPQPVSRELRPIEYFLLKLGSHTQSKEEKGEVIRGVLKMEFAKEWDHIKTGMAGDIAILQLNESVRFSDTIKPIALPKKGDQLADGTECTLAGWGKINADKHPDELYEISVKIQNGDTCTTTWNKENPAIKFNQTVAYCAGPGNQKPSMCNGDSGSPLFCKQNDQYVIHGLASIGKSPCGIESPPSAYTKIAAYIDWIDATIAAWSQVKPNGN